MAGPQMGDVLSSLNRLIATLVIVWVWCPAHAWAQSAIRGLHAERFDVVLTLLADGSIDVKETVVFHFTEKTFSKVEREIPLRRTDGVIDVRASLDGRVLGEAGDTRARIRTGRRTLRVEWRFPDTSNQRHAFTLEYRAMGALAIANGRAMLDFFVLPSRHRYGIDVARVEWRVPASVVRVTPTTMDDPRWTSLAMMDGWAATRQHVGVHESARIVDAFDATTLAAAVPAWQSNADRALQMAPAFLIGALTLLVMAAGVVGMMKFRYYQPAAYSGTAEPVQLDGFPPAMGTALVSGSLSIGLAQMQATLLDLARRGRLEIRERHDEPGRFDLVMLAVGPAAQTRPHEQVVLDAVWLQAKGGRVDLKTAWRQASAAFAAYRRSLLTELEAAGLVDAERRSAAKALRVSGLVILLLGMAGVAVFVPVFGHLGDLPLVVPGAVVISGVWFVIASHMFSVLSGAGVAAAAEWVARRRWIKETAKAPMSGADVNQWLPVAAGFGLAGPLLKAGQGELGPGAAAFAWLRDVRDPGAALAVIMTSTTTSAHSGAGGGGGAAGGGSSSAS